MESMLEELRLLVQARYPFIYLVSFEEERVVRALRWLTGTQDDRLSMWTSTMGFETAAGVVVPETEDPLAALEFVEARDPKQLFLLKDFHPFLDRVDIVRKLRDLVPRLEKDQKTVFFLSPHPFIPPELEKDFVTVDVPLPSPPEVSKLLGTLIKSQGIEVTADLYEKVVKASLGLTEKEIKKVYTKLLISGKRFTEEGLEALVEEKRRILRRSRFLEYVDLTDQLSDIGGLGQLKQWLVERGDSFSERAREFGLPPPKGLFLLGVQGCGKSLTAKAVARLWKLPLLRLDLASMFTAGTAGVEQNLRETIRVAESMAPTVIWIDEIEKAFGGISSAGAERGPATRVFGALLTWLQEKTKPVFVIATANDVTNLPPELLRKGRFDEIFFIDLPNVHERAEILAIHLRKRGRDPDDFQLYTVAELTEKYSGAELEQLVISAMFYAFSRGRQLETQDLLRQARESVPLAVTMDEQIKALKEWSRYRTRPAAYDTRRMDFFEEWEEVADDEIV